MELIKEVEIKITRVFKGKNEKDLNKEARIWLERLKRDILIDYCQNFDPEICDAKIKDHTFIIGD